MCGGAHVLSCGNDNLLAVLVMQVRVRLREERPPLEEAKFRPILYHYDGPKFRLELTVPEVSWIVPTSR